MTAELCSYTLALKRELIACHYLVGGDWGPENAPHSHRYLMEVHVEGDRLDRHGYLVDLDALSAAIDRLVLRYRDRTLNELPEFEGLNPSIEHFARIACESLVAGIDAPLRAITVRIWENEAAWAQYRRPFP
jgi:6-pyruvoyltetrahydropterin/6-carboxytetrahydropterin synthase